MATEKMDPFKLMDDALETSYVRLGYSNYRGLDGKGLFLKYVIEEESNDPELPIETELGDNCDPNDCAYSWINNETEFPLPSYAVIPNPKKEAFICYLLQHCFKFGQAPSDQYIKSVLIPKCGGTINDTLPMSVNTNQTITPQMTVYQKDDNNTIEKPEITEHASSHQQQAPVSYPQAAAVNASTADNNKQSNHIYSKQILDPENTKDDDVDYNEQQVPAPISQGVATNDKGSNHIYSKQLSDPGDAKDDDVDYNENNENIVAVPQRINIDHIDLNEKQVISMTATEFKPKYPARSYLNIFTAKDITKELKCGTINNTLSMSVNTNITTITSQTDAATWLYTQSLDTGDTKEFGDGHNKEITTATTETTKEIVTADNLSSILSSSLMITYDNAANPVNPADKLQQLINGFCRRCLPQYANNMDLRYILKAIGDIAKPYFLRNSVYAMELVKNQELNKSVITETISRLFGVSPKIANGIYDYFCSDGVYVFKTKDNQWLDQIVGDFIKRNRYKASRI